MGQPARNACQNRLKAMGKTHPITITHLEMLAPLTQVVPRPAQQIAIVRAQNPPVHFYRYLYNTVGANHVWVDRSRLSDEALADIIHHAFVEIYLLHVQGCPAGYAELNFAKANEAEISYFGLMPEFTGKGFGRFFLSETIHLAWTHNIDRLTVQTCTKDHPAALPLYQRLGFSPYAQSDDVVEDIDE